MSLWLVAALVAVATPATGNSLKGHPSPYLALHGDDPVDWLDLGPEAVDRSRADDRLLLLSIGYFACHWCHVMQQESFRNAAIAEKLNRNFVPVKIDRELEPALDARMVAFAEKTLGRAGWPLNVFVTPDGDPLFAVLYMPPGDFEGVLDRLHALWTNDRHRLAGLAARAAARDLPDADPVVDKSTAKRLEGVFVEQALALHDTFEGGFGSQSKFPQAPALDYLVELARGPDRGAVRDLLRVTLDAMAGGGLYDHVGGGFFRYVVDPGWQTPHFEKMLYDNAQLAVVYLRAAVLFPGRPYREIARATLDFMRRDLAAQEGALIASLSAVDANGVEGGYYLFTDDQLEEFLEPDKLRVVRAHCDVAGAPVLAAGHHLRCSRSLSHAARNMGIDESAARGLFESARQDLLAARQSRTLPADTKLLAGWNGLALSAFSEAAATLEDAGYAATAERIHDYLVTRLWQDGRLARARSGDTAVGTASVEDYAFVARGLRDYARVIGSDTDRALAREITIAGFERFRHAGGWRMAESALLAPEPPRELVTDSPLEAPTAVLAGLALDFGLETGNDALLAQSVDALNRAFDELAANAFFHATHIRALNRLAAAR